MTAAQKHTPEPEIPTVFYQSPELAAYSAAAMSEGADPEFAGPSYPGWYFMATFGDWRGPFDSEAAAWAPVVACVNAFAGMDPEAVKGLVEAADDILGHYRLAMMALKQTPAQFEDSREVVAARAALASLRGGK